MNSSILKTKVDYENYDVTEERRLLLSFLEQKQWTIQTEFLDHFKAGDIIEVYGFPAHTQVYANKEFLKLSSYSPEQMSTLPFQKLFWRESDIQQQLIKRAVQVVEGGKPQKWDLPPHDLVESLHPNRRTFEMHMGWLTPVYDKDGAPVAWASTLRVEYVFEWPLAASDTD